MISPEQLQPIILPPAVSWWPPALGWWLVLLLLLFLGGAWYYRAQIHPQRIQTANDDPLRDNALQQLQAQIGRAHV